MLPRMNDKSVRGSKRFARVEVANRPSLRIRVGAASFEEPAMERDEGEPLDLFGPRPHRVPAETRRVGYAHPMDGARPPPMAERVIHAARDPEDATADPEVLEGFANRGAGRLLPRKLSPGEGPQAREEPTGGPPHEEHPALPLHERECDADQVSEACFADRAWWGCRGVICVAATVAVATARAVAATLTAAAPPPPSSALKQAIAPPTSAPRRSRLFHVSASCSRP